VTQDNTSYTFLVTEDNNTHMTHIQQQQATQQQQYTASHALETERCQNLHCQYTFLVTVDSQSSTVSPALETERCQNQNI